MKTAWLLLLLAAPAFAQVLNLDKAPLLDAPGPGYRGNREMPLLLEARQSVSEPPATRWQLYSPKDLPEGKRIPVAEAAKLAKGAYDSPQLYLTGDFVVVATAADRAVLRDSREPGLARIVVIYPPEITIPAEGAKFGRDVWHPLKIRNVERTDDGVVTIFVREIIAPVAAPFLHDMRTQPKK